MNARNFAACALAYFILATSAAVLCTDSPRALAQASGPRARGPGAPDRPPGVPPDRWISINGALGIVIVHAAPPMRGVPGRAAPQPLEGYFAVYRAGRWWRLLTNVGSLMPLAQTGVAASSAR